MGGNSLETECCKLFSKRKMEWWIVDFGQPYSFDRK